MKKALFVTPWKNCWIRYISKFFEKSERVKIDWNLANQMNVYDMTKNDAVVFCWADKSLEKLSKLPFKYCKRYIAFVRSFEIFYGIVPKIDWRTVDDAIFVNRAFYDEYRQKIESAGTRVHYLPNAIDLDEWRKQDHRKSFNVGFVADLTHKKGIDLLPQFLNRLVRQDARYHLYVAGSGLDSRHVVYVKHVLKELSLDDYITFCGKVSDIKEWWQDKDYLFTCSVTEGHPNNVIEAMSLGVKPVIHNWRGASHNFPADLIWTDLDRAVELVTEEEYDSDRYRKYAEDNFDMWKIYPNLEEIISL